MITHDEMIKLQAEEHFMIQTGDFKNFQEYVLFLIHLKAYEEAAKQSVGKNVLDLGCNNGFGTHIISEKCNKIIGADVSQKAINMARDAFSAYGIKFEKIDGKTLSFENDSFDLVTSFQVIEHIVDYDIYLGEIIRVLKPEGMALFTTPNAVLRIDPGTKPWNPFHSHEFTPVELKNLLQNYFTEVSIKGLFATQEAYEVEYSRVTRGRLQARRRRNLISRVYDGVKYRLTNTLPFKKYKIRVGNPEHHSSKECLENSIQKKFSINDFYYQENELDKALDLMAVCSQSKKDVHVRR